MSFTDVLQELPSLTFEQMQLLIRRALELDDLPLSAADESLVESRLKALRDAPASAVSLEEMKARLRSRDQARSAMEETRRGMTAVRSALVEFLC